MYFRPLRRDQVQCACSYKPEGAVKFVTPEWLPEHNADKEYTPSYNIAPTDVTPVLLSSMKYKNAATTDRVLKPMMWGVIPPWHQVGPDLGTIMRNSVVCYGIQSSVSSFHFHATLQIS